MRILLRPLLPRRPTTLGGLGARLPGIDRHEKQPEIMPAILICLVILGVAILCWSQGNKSFLVRFVTVLIIIVIAVSLAYSFGKGTERLRNYDRYIYPFSQYSSDLCDLVRQQNITELTNDVVLFDGRFNRIMIRTNCRTSYCEC